MTIVYDWHKRFREDRAEISDDFRNGRSRISNSTKNIQTSKLQCTWFRSREEFESAVCSAMARFGVDFYKDITSEWMERHMECDAYGGLLFRKGMRDIIRV